jgi:uncharacterized protein (TIGR02996 family)
MTERDALLRAVCENPEDDTPRLVFADWLQENGNESDRARAEFIRLQVASERLPMNSRARQPYFVRERELLDLHEGQWLAELSDAFFGQRFVRGFVESAQIGQIRPVTRQAIEVLFDTSPLVELAIYRLTDPGMLATIPALVRLRKLSLGLQNPSDDSIDRFVNATNLTALQSLGVFTSSAVAWNSPEVPQALVERLRKRFQGVLVIG